MRHALLFLATISSAAMAADKPTRPNIVFMLSDDHRWDGLGAAGNADIRTPNLDRFCGQAVHFINGSVAVPQCCPSRAALLTGLFPHQNGYFSNKSWTKDAGAGFSRPTAIELLRDAGYDTALIGKWHIRPPPWKVGFTEIRTWMPQGADAYVDAKLAKGKSDKVDEFSGHVTEIFSTDAIRFLRRREETPDQPFFLWLAYTAPHTPQKPVPERCCEPYYRLPAGHCPPGFPAGEKKTGPWAQYYSAITHLDEQIGRVLEAIDGGVLKDNTVVFFLGDNGWMMGSHGRFGKNLPDDESSRVPFVVRAPAGVQGWIGKSDAMASSIDLPPTWLALAGVAVPEEWRGESLLPLLRDQKPARAFRDYVLSEFEDEKEFPGFSFRMIRTHEWKYIVRPPRGAKELKKLLKKLEKTEEEKDRKVPELAHEQLFELSADPHELKDVARAQAAAPALRTLRRRLEEHMTQTNDHALQWMRGNPAPAPVTDVETGNDNDGP